MTRHVPAALLVVTCWVGAPVFAQEPAPTPVLRPAPDSATRGPVNATPAQPEPPVKVEVPQPPPAAPPPEEAGTGSASSNAGKGERREEASAQRRGGGGGRGGSGGGGRGSSYPGGGGRGGPNPGWGSRGWHGWPAPVYFARPYYYDPFWVSGAFGWSPMFYAPWSLMWGTAGYWPAPWYGATTFNTGGLRLKVKPREAQVIVNGYYAGVVDEFDGVFQSLRLAPGGHKIEVRMTGFETLTFDVHVQPDHTLTLTEMMKANP